MKMVIIETDFNIASTYLHIFEEKVRVMYDSTALEPWWMAFGDHDVRVQIRHTMFGDRSDDKREFWWTVVWDHDDDVQDVIDFDVWVVDDACIWMILGSSGVTIDTIGAVVCSALCVWWIYQVA